MDAEVTPFLPRFFSPYPLAFLSAVLFILSFPPFHVAGFAWVSLLPLIYALQHQPVRKPFLLGWISGTAAYSGVLYWLVVTFQTAHVSIFLALGCLVLLSAYLGLFWGAWAWWVAHASRTIVGTLSIAAAWVGLEYLRTYLFSGFPWALLADSQYQNLPLIQIASVTGVYGVSFLLTFANVGWSVGRKAIPLSITLIIAVLLFGTLRLHDESPPQAALPVALLQGSIDQYKKWDSVYVSDIEHTYEALSTNASIAHPFLIVWPETSVPGYLLQDPPLWTWLDGVVRKSATFNLVGAPVIHNLGAYNSAFMIGSDGRVAGEYAKTHLVPFGEIVPWASVLGRYIRVLNQLGGFSAGSSSSVLYAGAVPVGVNICYEAIFPNLVRKSVVQGAQLIVNLTNDGWYMLTGEPYQHLAPNIFRAIEDDRWVLRADNTGISAIIDNRGRITAQSPLFQPWVVKGNVIPLQTKTPYTRLGDLFAWLCIAGCLAMSLLRLRKNTSPLL